MIINVETLSYISGCHVHCNSRFKINVIFHSHRNNDFLSSPVYQGEYEWGIYYVRNSSQYRLRTRYILFKSGLKQYIVNENFQGHRSVKCPSFGSVCKLRTCP